MTEFVSLDETGIAANRLRGAAVRSPLIPFTGGTTANVPALIKPEQVGELTFPHIQARPTSTTSSRSPRKRCSKPSAASPAVLNRDAREVSITSATDGPVVAVLSGGNADPPLLTEILQTESYTG